MFYGMEAEGLAADYDSYSALICSYLKESLRSYRQFAASHPGMFSYNMYMCIYIGFMPHWLRWLRVLWRLATPNRKEWN